MKNEFVSVCKYVSLLSLEQNRYDARIDDIFMSSVYVWAKRQSKGVDLLAQSAQLVQWYCDKRRYDDCLHCRIPRCLITSSSSACALHQLAKIKVSDKTGKGNINKKYLHTNIKLNTNDCFALLGDQLADDWQTKSSACVYASAMQ